jgi:hypothetical protein
VRKRSPKRFRYCTAADLEPDNEIDCCGSGTAFVLTAFRNDDAAVIYFRRHDDAVSPPTPIRCLPSTRFRRKV